MLKKVLLGLLVALALLAAYLFLWPVDIDPLAWRPPEPPALEGPYAPNDALAEVVRVELDGEGPEDVAIDAAGRMYAGLTDGRIVRLQPDGSDLEVFADTGGRPLGLDFDADGNLLVADAVRGLLRIAPDGTLEVLATEHDGLAFGFTDDVDVGPDGTVFFSDASHRWQFPHYREDVIEGRPYGRLLAWDPRTRQTRLLADGLHFANGVAVSPQGDFVLVNETPRYRILRYWLAGPRTGETEVLLDNLPGFPDGISAGTGGRFWIALFSPRLPMLDGMADKPWLRRLVYRLPLFLQPKPVRHGLVLAIDGEGNVVANLQDASEDSYSPVTSVEEHGGRLYLGSVSYPGLAHLPVPE